MSIRPVVMNGMIQRTQDVGNLKQQEDSKPFVQQQNIAIQQEKQEDRLTHQVQQSKEKENEGYRYDAKEKGNNQYEANKGKKKKKQQEEEPEPLEDGEVRYRGAATSFDMKI